MPPVRIQNVRKRRSFRSKPRLPHDHCGDGAGKPLLASARVDIKQSSDDLRRLALCRHARDVFVSREFFTVGVIFLSVAMRWALMVFAGLAGFACPPVLTLECKRCRGRAYSKSKESSDSRQS